MHALRCLAAIDQGKRSRCRVPAFRARAAGRFEVQAGDVLLVPAGEAHRAHRTARTTIWGVGFCAPCYAPSELARLLDPFERARSGASPIVRLAAERHDHVNRLLAELAARVRERARG